MKRKVFALFIGLLLSFSALAQAPNSFKYQAVIRDASGNSVCNQEIGAKVSILQGDSNGTSVYEESFSPTTNQFGLIALNIGEGTVISGDISAISWGDDSCFIKIEMDLEGGNNYVEFGTSQLMSVPYALHATTAANYNETDPAYAAWDKSTGIIITESQVSDLEHFTNDDEIDPVYSAWDKSTGIIITESQISDLDHFTNDDEIDPVYSAWDKSYADLTNVPSIVDTVNDILDTTSQFVREELDGDPLNEIQTIALTDNLLSIESGNNVDLSVYLDNTDSQGLNLDGTTLEITNGSNVDLSSLIADGSETKIIAGDDIFVTGTGTENDPYVLSASKTYSIGLDTTLGGYVFYVTPNGKHGLVVAMQDQSTSTQWWEARDQLNKADNHNSYGKNFLDWRLPTMYELTVLESFRTEIGVISSGTGYWSSLGYSQGSTNARYYLFNYSPNERFGYMYSYRRVRAVRSF